MKVVLQRVSQASVTVDGKVVGEIGHGLLALVGFEQGDDDSKLAFPIKKLQQLRIFSDAQGKMNQSIQDVGGAFLIVSQFTLAGDCRQGNRPGFDKALPPVEAETLYNQFVETLRKESNLQVETGIFRAMMAVTSTNDGPVTFLLEN